MPKKDRIHAAVKNALIKDGWTIPADPFVIEYQDIQLYADLEAERPLAAERGDEKIVVEIKGFLSPSPIHDFEVALGQYEMYRSFLELTAPTHRLYLAISHLTHESLFERPAI